MKRGRAFTRLSWYGLLLLFMAREPAIAQRYVYGPATSLTDFKALYANPALTLFQDASFAAGAKLANTRVSEESGVPVFRHGLAALSYPYLLGGTVGLGATLQHFDSPIYRRSLYGVNVAVRPLPFVALGVQLAGQNVSYNERNFDLVDPGDPVFAQGTGRTVLTSGIGFLLEPSYGVRLGLGVRNLNDPDVSLIGDKVMEGRAYYAALTLARGIFQSTFEVTSQKDITEGRSYIEFTSSNRSYFRGGVNVDLKRPQDIMSGLFEAQLYLGGPLRVNIGYDLPLGALNGVSKGSFEFAVAFDLGRPAPEVFVHPPFEDVTVYEKHLHRQIDSDLSDEAVAVLAPSDVGIIDADFGPVRPLPYLIPDPERTGSGKTRFYHRTKTASDTLNGLVRRSVQPKSDLFILSPDHIDFRLGQAFAKGILRSWTLIVEHADNHRKWTHTGTGSPPKRLTWNWRYDDGGVIEPGVHRCWITWLDRQGASHTSRESSLFVSKVARTISVEVTRDATKVPATSSPHTN